MSNPFHEHLDVCERCRERPFDLCPRGEAALKMAAMGHEPPGFRSPTDEERLQWARAERKESDD